MVLTLATTLGAAKTRNINGLREGIPIRTDTMKVNRTQERKQAHTLLDQLSDEQVDAVRNLLEVMVEPLARALGQAEVDDEAITPETAEALDRARTSIERGDGIPHEDIFGEFGLKQ